jgi:hypothetical protein
MPATHSLVMVEPSRANRCQKWRQARSRSDALGEGRLVPAASPNT